MKKLELQKCIVGSVYTNCYFLKNKETGELLIVDPGDAADTIERKVSEMQGKPVGILLTHGHFDHIMAADEVRKKYNIPIYASEKEETTLLNPKVNLSVFGHGSCTLDADVYLKDLQTVELAGFSVQMIETPGHTVGRGCAFQWRHRISGISRKNGFSGGQHSSNRQKPSSSSGCTAR